MPHHLLKRYIFEILLRWAIGYLSRKSVAKWGTSGKAVEIRRI
jgi:hypothetical protein